MALGNLGVNALLRLLHPDEDHSRNLMQWLEFSAEHNKVNEYLIWVDMIDWLAVAHSCHSLMYDSCTVRSSELCKKADVQRKRRPEGRLFGCRLLC